MNYNNINIDEKTYEEFKDRTVSIMQETKIPFVVTLRQFSLLHRSFHIYTTYGIYHDRWPTLEEIYESINTSSHHRKKNFNISFIYVNDNIPIQVDWISDKIEKPTSKSGRLWRKLLTIFKKLK
jgi:hypothetical protein